MLRFIALKSEKSAGGSPEIQYAPLGSKRDVFWADADAHAPTIRKTVATAINRLINWNLPVESRSPTLNGPSDRRQLPRDRRRIVPRRAPEPSLRCSRCRSEEHTSELQSPCNLVCR